MISEENSYRPILSLKPAEMAALEELPEKVKDLIVPIIPIKKWANSKTLEKSLHRVEKAIGSRPWIIDIDKGYAANLSGKESSQLSDVDKSLQSLINPNNGYENWVDFISDYENLIPIVQLDELSELEKQIDKLLSIDRLMAVRFIMSGQHPITTEDFNTSIKIILKKKEIDKLFIVLDYGDLDRSNLVEYKKFSSLVSRMSKLLPKASFAISGTSFPYSFAGSYKGEIPIYERQIFNKVRTECPDVDLFYSDRGSARAESFSGGAGSPPVRIDYPLKNDWRFIRKEFDGRDKEDIYQEAAIEVMNSDFWDEDLRLWGTQMIEKTSSGDAYGITTPQRSTAVRINIHLYQQLYYNSNLSELDTDEDWED